MNQLQSLLDIQGILKRRIVPMAFVILLGCALSVYFAIGQTKVYETTAVIQIEDAQIANSIASPTAPAINPSHRLRLIEQRLMSRDNLIKIIDKYQLFVGIESIGQRVFMLRQAARIEQITGNTQSWQPSQAPSGLIITVRLDDPEKAADVANELLASVIEQSRERNAVRARDTLNFFESEATRVGNEITTLEAEIAAFKQTNSQSLAAGLATQRTQLANLRETELEIDREIIALESNSSRQRREVLSRQIALLEEQKALIATRILEIESAIAAAPEVEKQFNSLSRSLTELQDQNSVITRRRAEAEMAQLLEDRQQSERFEILETALVPEAPVSRSRKKTAIMGGVASVIAAFGLAFLMEMLNPAIRNAVQLERQLGLQPVVSIPTIRTKAERRRIQLAWFAGAITLVLAVPLVIKALQAYASGTGLFGGASQSGQ